MFNHKHAAVVIKRVTLKMSTYRKKGEPVPWFPFPGKYPTRIAWVVKFPDGRKAARYSGKPTAEKVQQFFKLAEASNGSCWAVEVDRKGNYITYHSGLLRRHRNGSVPAQSYNAYLAPLYHPEHGSLLFGSLGIGKCKVQSLARGYKFYCTNALSMDVHGVMLQDQFDTATKREDAKPKTTGV